MSETHLIKRFIREIRVGYSSVNMVSERGAGHLLAGEENRWLSSSSFAYIFSLTIHELIEEVLEHDGKDIYNN